MCATVGAGTEKNAKAKEKLHALRLFLGQQEDTCTSLGQVTKNFLKLTETVPLSGAKDRCDPVLRGTAINDACCFTEISLLAKLNVTYTGTNY